MINNICNLISCNGIKNDSGTPIISIKKRYCKKGSQAPRVLALNGPDDNRCPNHFRYCCLFVVLENILNCKSVSYKFSVNFMVYSFWKPGLFPLNGFAQTPNHFHMIFSIDLIIFKIFQVHIIGACNRRIGTKCACFIISFKTVKLIQWNTTVGSILQNYWSPFCPLSGLSGRHTRGIYVVR